MRIFWSIAIAVLPLVTFGQVPFSLQDRAFLQTTSPLRKDLAGYWRLEESSGTRYDFSKNGNHLTSNNSVGQAAGVSGYTGNAATFVSGSSQFLSVNDNDSLSTSGASMALSCWLYMTNKTGTQRYITKWGGTSSGTCEFALGYDSGPDRFNFYMATNGNSTGFATAAASSFGSPSINTWYHLTGGYDSVNKLLWVGVNLVTNSISANITATNTVSPFLIGAICTLTNVPGTFFSGRVDEVGYWKGRYLSDSDRIQLYNAGLGTHFPWAHP